MTVGGGRADIARLQRPEARRQRLAGKTDAEWPRKHLRKQRQHGRAPSRWVRSHRLLLRHYRREIEALHQGGGLDRPPEVGQLERRHYDLFEIEQPVGGEGRELAW